MFLLEIPSQDSEQSIREGEKGGGQEVSCLDFWMTGSGSFVCVLFFLFLIPFFVVVGFSRQSITGYPKTYSVDQTVLKLIDLPVSASQVLRAKAYATTI